MMNEHKKKIGVAHSKYFYLASSCTHFTYNTQGLRMATFQLNEIFIIVAYEWMLFCWINWLNRHSCNVLHVSMVFHVIWNFSQICTTILHWCLLHSTLLVDIGILIFNIFFICYFCLPVVEGLSFLAIQNSACP